jgi:hypothetical protein
MNINGIFSELYDYISGIKIMIFNVTRYFYTKMCHPIIKYSHYTIFYLLLTYMIIHTYIRVNEYI